MRAVLIRNATVPPFAAAVPDATITRLAELHRLPRPLVTAHAARCCACRGRMWRVGSPLRTTPAGILAVTAALAFLAACGTAAGPAASTGTGPRRGPGASPGASWPPARPRHRSRAPATATRPSGRRAPPVPPRAVPRSPGLRTARCSRPTTSGTPTSPSSRWTPHSAAWLRSMDSASTLLHPDFGPDPGGFPYGIPYKIVTNAHRLSRSRSSTPARATRGRTRSARTSDRGRQERRPATGTRSWSTRHLHAVRAVARPVLGRRLDGGLRRDLEPALQPATPRRLDLRRRGGPAHPARAAELRQIQAAVKSGQPITHAIRFTAQVTQSAYLWPARHEAGSGREPDRCRRWAPGSG